MKTTGSGGESNEIWCIAMTIFIVNGPINETCNRDVYETKRQAHTNKETKWIWGETAAWMNQGDRKLGNRFAMQKKGST